MLSGAALLLLCAGTAWAFDFEELAERARELAAAPYKAPTGLPKELQGLEYDLPRHPL